MTQTPSPASIIPLFATEIYRAELANTPLDPLITRLDRECRRIADQDKAGQAASMNSGYLGYTSYYTIHDLEAHSGVFAELRSALDVQAALFAKLLHMDLRDRPLKMTAIWINVLAPGGSHSGHIHPHSVFSGTLYISIPPRTSGLRLEDPRHPVMMHAPLPLPGNVSRQSHLVLPTTRGSLLLWESWLRHDVPTNLAHEDRISISFNYDLLRTAEERDR